MKVRINLTIEDSVLDCMKRYAVTKQESGSERVEEYFLTINGRDKSVVDLIAEKERPSISGKKDLKRALYEEQAQKYGF